MTGFVAEKIPFLQNHWYFRKVCAVPNGLLKISPFCEGFPSWLALDNATALRLTGNSSWPVTKRLSSGSGDLLLSACPTQQPEKTLRANVSFSPPQMQFFGFVSLYICQRLQKMYSKNESYPGLFPICKSCNCI